MAHERILIVDTNHEDLSSLRERLCYYEYVVESANDGNAALRKLKETPFDILLTELSFSGMTGLDLISRVRKEVTPSPLIIIVTTVISSVIKRNIGNAGIFDYMLKPVNIRALHKRIEEGHKLHGGGTQLFTPSRATPPRATAPPVTFRKPPFVCVVVASSTGGPQTLEKVFNDFPASSKAACFVVQHGVDWMLGVLAERLAQKSGIDIRLAREAMSPQKGKVYMAPGDRHMVIDPKALTMKLWNGPKENFVRPAADPLFRSAADIFGSYCVAVVLSGLGRDGALGVQRVVERGGVALIQDPKTAIAPYMPQAAIASEAKSQVVPLEEMGRAIESSVIGLAAKLGRNGASS